MSCLIVGAICLAIASAGSADQSGEGGKAYSGKLPDEVCRAIEQYIAAIDAARALKDKADRGERYAAAQQALMAGLQRFGKTSLLADITSYAQQSELVSTTDPTDVTFDKRIAERLNTRSKLLDWCSSFTIKR